MLAAERKVTSKLLEQDTSAEKLYVLNEYAIIFHFYPHSASVPLYMMIISTDTLRLVIAT